jgi:hypothetical protein
VNLASAALATFAIGIVITGALAARYVRRIYLSDRARPRSRLLLLFTGIVYVIEVFGILLVALTIPRLLGAPPLPFSPALVSIGLIGVMLIPHIVALYVYHGRHPGASTIDALRAVLAGTVHDGR